MSVRRWLAVFAGTACIAMAVPVRAQDNVEQFLEQMTPDERQLLPQMMEATDNLQVAPEASLAKLDTVLQQLTKPTPFRGAVQLARATVLATLNRYEASLPAISEAIRLMPGSAMPKLTGTHIYIFTGDVAQAADLWMEASRQNPNMARLQDDYVTGALLGRLEDKGDRRRADLVRARLVEIGYAGAADYVVDVMRTRMKSGDIAGARQLIPSIVRPDQFAALLVDRKFAALWPNIEDWAGAGLERQWPLYLDSLRRRWEATRSLDSGLDYARALAEAGDFATIVVEFEPAMANDDEIRTAFEAQYLGPVLANALIETGRADDAFKLFARLAALWPSDDPARGAAALNISGNWAKRQLEQGDPRGALDRIDGVIRAAVGRGPEVNSSALLAMHLVRICASHELARDTDAAQSASLITIAQNTNPSIYIGLLACSGRRAEAKSFLLRRLADAEAYPFALNMLQPRPDIPRSAYLLKIKRFTDDLGKDREITAALNKVGRKISFPIWANRPAR